MLSQGREDGPHGRPYVCEEGRGEKENIFPVCVYEGPGQIGRLVLPPLEIWHAGGHPICMRFPPTLALRVNHDMGRVRVPQ